jgi:hypothetical protein
MGTATLIFLGGLIDKIICLALELFSNNIKPTEGKSMALLLIYIPPYLTIALLQMTLRHILS